MDRALVGVSESAKASDPFTLVDDRRDRPSRGESEESGLHPPRSSPAYHTSNTQRNRSRPLRIYFPQVRLCLCLAQKELKEGGRGARKSAPSHACFFSSLMALRVNIKDLGGSGFDAHTTQLNKKKGLQPPVGASPGELRLWRKLNGLLTDDEKKVDALEHNKAKSRANLAGRPRHSIAPNEGLRRMSEIPSDSAAAPTGAASSGSARRMSTSGSSSPASRSRASSTTTSAHASPRKARPSSPARASPARPRTSAAPAPASGHQRQQLRASGRQRRALLWRRCRRRRRRQPLRTSRVRRAKHQRCRSRSRIEPSKLPPPRRLNKPSPRSRSCQCRRRKRRRQRRRRT